MRIEEVRPAVFRLTLHAQELSSIVAASRWVVAGAEGELPPEAREQLRKVLASYDQERARLSRTDDGTRTN